MARADLLSLKESTLAVADEVGSIPVLIPEDPAIWRLPPLQNPGRGLGPIGYRSHENTSP